MPARTLALATLVLTTTLLLPVHGQGMEFRQGDNLSIQDKFIDNLLAAGGTITAEFTSTDDVFMAGGDVQYKAVTERDLFLAGGSLRIRDTQAQLAAVAGGSVDVSRSKFQELIIAGGNVRFIQTQIDDDLMTASGNLQIDGATRVGGSSLIAGGKVILGGHFTQTVRVIAEKLVVESTAVFEGDFIYSADDADIHPKAQIRGQSFARPFEDEDRDRGIAIGLLGLLLFAGSLLVAPTIAICTPLLVTESTEEIRTRFWASLGRGTLMALMIPAVIGVLLISIVGTPLGLALIPLAISLFVVSWSIASHLIGDTLKNLLTKSEPDTTSIQPRNSLFGWTLLGSLILTLVFLIPFLGILIYIIAMLTALGGTWFPLQKRRGD